MALNPGSYNFDQPGELERYMQDMLAANGGVIPQAAPEGSMEQYFQSIAPQAAPAAAPTFTPSQWAQSMGLGDLERMINSGTATPEALKYLEANLGHPVGDPQAAWNEFVRRTQDNGSASPFSLSNLGKVIGATTGFQVGGATGADIGQNVASGQSPSNVDFGRDLTLDAAGLGAGVGLSSALPALGLSTPAAALATEGGAAGAGTVAADPSAFLPGAAGAEVPVAPMGPEAFLPGASAAAPAAAAAGATTAAAMPPATAAAGATGAVGTAAAAGAGGIGATKLSDVLSGNVNPLDNLTLGNLGTIGATAGSIAADIHQADQMKAMYEQYLGLGAPSRQRYEQSFDPNFDVSKLPGLQSAMDTSYQGLLRGLSTHGNPYGNPGGLAEAQKYIMGNVALPTLQNYRNQNAATGGFGAFSSAAPGVGTGAITAGGNAVSDLGRGVSNVLNPPTSLEQFFKQMKGGIGGLT